jgi:hypothetical protein
LAKEGGILVDLTHDCVGVAFGDRGAK